MCGLRTLCFVLSISIIFCLPLKNVIVEAPDLSKINDVVRVANLTDQINNSTEQRVRNVTRLEKMNQVRPGMTVTNYVVEIEPNVNAGTFNGRVAAQVIIEDHDTREDDIIFQVRDIAVQSVEFSLAGGNTFQSADFSVDDDDGILEISTGFRATLYSFIIQYRGSLSIIGDGLYAGRYDNGK